ncbi:MAG TPA: prolyl oligopeptidase family serine peptidase [Armatimonadota bacterium]|jgi:dipeptidyl aminopeptidase/acylaminoacyl peptidase
MQWTINDVAWIGKDAVAGEITGVVVSFHGLGYTELKREANPEEQALGAQGALVVLPYYGPWSWMNREARAMVDALIGKIYQEYALDPRRVPLIVQGGSMGGGSALLYARYAAHPIAACFANCPVCDLPYHFTERADLPRTMYHAFGAYPGEMSDHLEEHSALHQVAQLPDTDYLIVHGEADRSVNKGLHSDRLVRAMRARELRVEYLEVPGMGHCGPLPEEVAARVRAFITGHLAS